MTSSTSPDERRRFLEYVQGLGDLADSRVLKSLRNEAAQRLREAAESRFSSDPPSELLVRAAAAYESSQMFALVMGWSIRVAEGELGAQAPPPDEAVRELDGASRPVEAVGVVARDLAKSAPPQEFVAAFRAGSATAEETLRASGPKKEMLAMFAPGADVWATLEEWIRAVGIAASSRRIQERLAAAGVAGFAIDAALARIDYEGALRFGYVLAACDGCLPPRTHVS